jgi:hypothetical protein
VDWRTQDNPLISLERAKGNEPSTFSLGNWREHQCTEFNAAHYEQELFAGLKDGRAVGKCGANKHSALTGARARRHG